MNPFTQQRGDVPDVEFQHGQVSLPSSHVERAEIVEHRTSNAAAIACSPSWAENRFRDGLTAGGSRIRTVRRHPERSDSLLHAKTFGPSFSEISTRPKNAEPVSR